MARCAGPCWCCVLRRCPYRPSCIHSSTALHTTKLTGDRSVALRWCVGARHLGYEYVRRSISPSSVVEGNDRVDLSFESVGPECIRYSRCTMYPEPQCLIIIDRDRIISVKCYIIRHFPAPGVRARPAAKRHAGRAPAQERARQAQTNATQHIPSIMNHHL